MELNIDVAAVAQSAGVAVIGAIGWYLRRQAEASKARDDKRDEKIDTLTVEFRDFKTTVNARFDGLQLAVDGHGKEQEIARESRGKINGRIDAQADRLTRVETRVEMLGGGHAAQGAK